MGKKGVATCQGGVENYARLSRMGVGRMAESPLASTVIPKKGSRLNTVR